MATLLTSPIGLLPTLSYREMGTFRAGSRAGRSFLTSLFVAAPAVAVAAAAIGWAIAGADDVPVWLASASVVAAPEDAPGALPQPVAPGSPAPCHEAAVETAPSFLPSALRGDEVARDRSRCWKQGRRGGEERPARRVRAVADRGRAEPGRMAAPVALGSRSAVASGETEDLAKTQPGTELAQAPLPDPVVEARPARSRAKGPLIVAASRVHRESGSVPSIRFASSERASPQLTAKLCIDPLGAVTSVTVLSPASPGVRATLERALRLWRYRPVVAHDERVAACFATTLRVQVNRRTAGR